MRRFIFMIVLLALPFRLWASVGMVVNMPVAPVAVEHLSASQAVDAAPCHEANAVATQSVAGGHSAACAGSECAVCAICHMSALQTLDSDWLVQSQPRAWPSQFGDRLYAAEAGSLFKPPVF